MDDRSTDAGFRAAQAPGELDRRLSAWDGCLITVGAVIGTGIFLTGAGGRIPPRGRGSGAAGDSGFGLGDDPGRLHDRHGRRPLEAAAGVAVVALGLPAYAWWRRRPPPLQP